MKFMATNEQILRSAIHEMGHAACHWYFGGQLVNLIVDEDGGGEAHFMEFRPDIPEPTDTQDDKKEQFEGVVGALGGRAAIELFYPDDESWEISEGCGEDMEGAAGLLEPSWPKDDLQWLFDTPEYEKACYIVRKYKTQIQAGAKLLAKKRELTAAEVFAIFKGDSAANSS
jgi:ATP-dependent Zn protease